jgi:broad specificity phosphatase PhoE
MRQGVELALAERQGQRIIIVGHGGLFIYTIQDLCPGVDLETLRKQETHNCAISEVSMTRNNGRWHGELQRWADFSHLSGYATELVSGSPTPSSVSGGGPG